MAIDLWPLPQSIDLPLYAAVFGAALIGFLIGAMVTWYSALARRRRARRAMRPEAPFQPALPAHPEGRAPILARYRAAVDEA
ncbi:MAG TPA: lipopolysaccharide assembly protein LapA domain-containing protein [Alphaproteobacteria bacterium]